MSDAIKVHVVQERDRKNLTMRYRDPITGKHVKRSSGTPNPKEAAKRAAKWEAEVNEGRYQRPLTITWAEFRERFEAEKLASPSISGATRKSYSSALNHLERVIDPDKLCKVTSETISRFVRELRKPQRVTRNGKKVLLPPMRESTIACHLRHVKAALNWALRMGLLNLAPSFDMPEAGEAKGRPITAEEFERMLQSVAKVRSHDPGVWTRFLYGLWLSGLRLEEAISLSWDTDEAFCVDASGRFPAFKIKARGQKARRAERVPLTPDFAEWLLQTPVENRHGPVFNLPGLLDGRPLTPKRVSRTISRIGKKAGVVVNRERKLVAEPILDPKTGKPTDQTQLVEKDVCKYASAHDLRRSFGTRWAQKVRTPVLQRLMRHANIATTMRYYVDLDSDEMAAYLWRGFEGGLGTSLGTIEPDEAKKAEEGPDGESSEPSCVASSYECGGQGTRTLNRQVGT